MAACPDITVVALKRKGVLDVIPPPKADKGT